MWLILDVWRYICLRVRNFVQFVQKKHINTGTSSNKCKFKGTTPTVIDIILVTNRKIYSGVLNCNCPVSDFHNFIGAATRRFAPIRKPCHIFYRSYKNFDDTDFCKTVLSSPFHVGEMFDDVEDMAWFTSNLLSDIIDEYVPIKRKLVKQESGPYMNAQLRKAMYQRNMACNKFRNNGKQYWQEIRRQRNQVIPLRKQSLRKYFSQRCTKKNKTCWKTISPFMTNKHTRNGNNIILREGDNTVIDNKAVCEIFNDYFANIASTIGFEDQIECVDSAIEKHILVSWKLRQVWTNSKTLTSDPSAQRKLIKNWNPLTLKKLLGVTTSQVKSYAWHTMSYQFLWLHWLTIVWCPTWFLRLWNWRTSVQIIRNLTTWYRETTDQLMW